MIAGITKAVLPDQRSLIPALIAHCIGQHQVEGIFPLRHMLIDQVCKQAALCVVIHQYPFPVHGPAV